MVEEKYLFKFALEEKLQDDGSKFILGSSSVCHSYMWFSDLGVLITCPTGIGFLAFWSEVVELCSWVMTPPLRVYVWVKYDSSYMMAFWVMFSMYKSRGKILYVLEVNFGLFLLVIAYLIQDLRIWMHFWRLGASLLNLLKYHDWIFAYYWLARGLAYIFFPRYWIYI